VPVIPKVCLLGEPTQYGVAVEKKRKEKTEGIRLAALVVVVQSNLVNGN